MMRTLMIAFFSMSVGASIAFTLARNVIQADPPPPEPPAPCDCTADIDAAVDAAVTATVERCSQLLDCKNELKHPYTCSPDCKYCALERLVIPQTAGETP